jgi:hypothetical protein
MAPNFFCDTALLLIIKMVRVKGVGLEKEGGSSLELREIGRRWMVVTSVEAMKEFVGDG